MPIVGEGKDDIVYRISGGKFKLAFTLMTISDTMDTAFQSLYILEFIAVNKCFHFQMEGQCSPSFYCIPVCLRLLVPL